MKDPDKIINLLKTLPLHSRLVLCACVRLLTNDNGAKIKVTDVFTKYKQLTARFNINWLSLGKVTEHIKELEMFGFLKCTYPQKGHAHQIRYIHIFEPADIPSYIAVLQAIFSELRGVEKVVSGYSGGSVPDPSYREVCTGTTRHAETVQITFDPQISSRIENSWRSSSPSMTLRR